MNYYPGYAFFRDQVDMVALLRGLSAAINTPYKLILELSGQREPLVYATLAKADLARQGARMEIKGFTLLAPLQQIDFLPTPGGYVAFDFRGFDDEWYEDRAPTPAELAAKHRLAVELLTALVGRAEATLAYISSAKDNTIGPVTPDAQSIQVLAAMKQESGLALGEALWSSGGALPWLVALNATSPCTQTLRTDYRYEIKREQHGDVILLEERDLNPWRIS
jgi:hypothetical protein